MYVPSHWLPGELVYVNVSKHNNRFATRIDRKQLNEWEEKGWKQPWVNSEETYDVLLFPVLEGDIVILCSDGMMDNMNINFMEKTLNDMITPDPVFVAHQLCFQACAGKFPTTLVCM